MGTEIERKFLVKTSELPEQLFAYPFREIIQGYLLNTPAVRVRMFITDGKGQGFITIKGPGLLKRKEFEFRIPHDMALALLQLAVRRSGVIHKMRYQIGRWEVDQFYDDHFPLWLAEIELDRETEKFGSPAFVGKEVTYDKRYGNVSLARDGLPHDHVQE